MTTNWPSNPFSTRFLSPGKISFVGIDEPALDRLAERFIRQRGNGQIIGPHGTGKTTLTFELEKRIVRLNATSVQYRFVRKTIGPKQTIRSAQSLASFEIGADRRLLHRHSPNPKTILVLDGIELLSWFQRIALIKTCRQKQIGLVVTSHRFIWGLPKLTTLRSDYRRFESIVQRLTCDCDFQISTERLTTIYQLHQGNIREALMSCYDEFEASRAKPVSRDKTAC